MHHDAKIDNQALHKRRLVLHGVIRQIAEQLPIPVPGKNGEVFALSLAMQAWKEYLRGEFFPAVSSEEVIKRDDWHTTLLAIEAWAAGRGVTFINKTEETKA